jgi:molybdate/tungstate transport system substrate-binding protein
MVIAYPDKSKYSSEINEDNWIDVLSRNDVIYARSDPDSDPCGYRTVLTFMLAEEFYDLPGLSKKLVTKNKEFIRPKEVDLIALIESNAIDYMFQYKSVAIQHGLKYIQLPDEINLSEPSLNNLYKTVSLEVTGSKPGTKMIVTGECINYSITIPENAINKDAAAVFLSFILSREGLEVFRNNGQEPITSLTSEQTEKLPPQILSYFINNKVN